RVYLLVLHFVRFIVKIFFKPLRPSHAGSVDVAPVDHHIGRLSCLKLCTSQVAAGSLQSVEHQPRRPVLHLTSAKQLHHLHQRHLHRIRIFQQRHHKPSLPKLAPHDPRPLLLATHMKKTKPPTPQRRRPTLCPIHLHMLTPVHIFQTHNSPHTSAPKPSEIESNRERPPLPSEIQNCREFRPRFQY